MTTTEDGYGGSQSADVIDLTVDDRRCPVSVMPGYHCGRPVASDQTVCENHLAMGVTAAR